MDVTELQSYACGRYRPGAGPPLDLHSAVTGAAVARVGGGALDFAAMAEHARSVGGPALRAMTFHQRAAMLKALAGHLDAGKEALLPLSFATGATRADSRIDIDGGIGTLFVYASKGRRELPDAALLLEGEAESLARDGSFLGRHLLTPRHGVAVHINAYNFPVWGMLEKLAPCLLAGMPAIVKPATATAYLAAAAFRMILDSGLLPEGSVQLIVGPTGDLLDRLGGQDVVSFTGSAETARALQARPALVENATRFIAERDSLNAAVLGGDAGPGSPEFDLFVDEVVREMTVKAGQKCTAIRRALVPRAVLDAALEAIRARLDAVRVGDPALRDTGMGALAGQAQRRAVLERIALLERECRRVRGDPDDFAVHGADREAGAFLPPLLYCCADPRAAALVHTVEPFGPVATVMPYDDAAEAVALVNRGEGSLVASVFTRDGDRARDFVLGAGAFHGRLLFVDRDSAASSTGHGSPLPHLVHGGPGRAGGGEELGGIRGVKHYMQRTAVQASPAMLAAVTGRHVPGAPERGDGLHPFRYGFDQLEVGRSLVTGFREIRLEDIEHFARFTGDTFYAHMDERAAAANPFFPGRVAHGYLILSFAAGLFVDPDPGPVLANYGIDELRFLKPVSPGDRIRVRLVAAGKTPRGADYGEVVWDVTVTNQDDEPVARYRLLTMNAIVGGPAEPGAAPV